jgi:glycine/D-amino acid oxidase-like deaminating enzyme
MSGATGPSLPTSARAVIVGAGIVGASVAYHLAREGWTDVVIVDQGLLWETGGSTSHAPGLVFQHNPSHTLTQMARTTVEVLSSLELDGQPCYHAVGGIEVAAGEERWAELDRKYGRSLGFGLNAALLSPAEVKERIPLIDADRIIGGLFVEGDGIAKAVRGAEAMGRYAQANAGLQAFGGCEATGLVVERGRVRAAVCAASRPRSARSTPTPSSCAPASGGRRPAGSSAG